MMAIKYDNDNRHCVGNSIVGFLYCNNSITKNIEMKKNMGLKDRMIRVLAAVVIAILYNINIISGTTAIILGAIALIFIVTSFISFCPLYVPFNISTMIKSKNHESRN